MRADTERAIALKRVLLGCATWVGPSQQTSTRPPLKTSPRHPRLGRRGHIDRRRGEDVFTGIAKVDDRLVILIDPAGLLTDLGITRLEAVA
jgi:hypothetical protein